MQVFSKYPEPGLQFAFGPKSDAWAGRYTKEPEAALAELDEADEWYALKTHEWPTDDRPAIYIARDGRDAIGSLSRFWGVPVPSLLDAVSVRHEHRICGMLAGVGGASFGSWSSHFLAWDIENRPNGLLVKFEDILSRPEEIAYDLSIAFGWERTGQWVDRFDEHKDQWRELFDDKNDEHRHSMAPEVEAMFWRLHGPVMRHLGFEKGGE